MTNCAIFGGKQADLKYATDLLAFAHIAPSNSLSPPTLARNMIKHFPLRLCLILPESQMTLGQLMLLLLLVCWISLSLHLSVPWFRIACFSSCTWLWLGMSEWPWVIELNRLGRRRAGGGNAQPVIIWLLTPLINPLLRDQCPNYFIITPGAAALVNKHYALCHRWRAGATNTGNDCRHHSVVDIKNLPPVNTTKRH